MSENNIKAIIIAVFSFLSSILGALYIPVLLMVACNVIDYITGLMAASYRNDGISSYRSIKGITKKVAMWLLVVVGAIIDRLIIYCTESLNIDIHMNFLVAAIVAIWIVCNELISILENIVDIGIKIPNFLKPIVTKIKNQAEKIASESVDSESEGNDNDD